MRILLALALLASPVLADGIPISGQITDANGNPAAGAEFGVEWSNKNGKLLPFQRWKPGADGKYASEFYPRKGPMVFFALDAAQKNGAIYVMEEKDLKAPMAVDLKLGPLSDVSGSLACPAIGPALGTTSVIVEVRPSGARVAWLTQKNDKFAMPLPPGDYDARAFANDAHELRTSFSVEPGGKPVVLGALALDPTEIAKAWGKPPPAFKATAARGMPAGVKLSDFKGKWVLLVLWSAKDKEFDEVARVKYQEMKDLLERQKEHAGKFEILALHDPSVKTWQEYDDEVANVKKGTWGGGDLPCPVLLDATGETWNAWGNEDKSRTVLIDPEGNVVRAGDVRMLEAKLDAK